MAATTTTTDGAYKVACVCVCLLLSGRPTNIIQRSGQKRIALASCSLYLQLASTAGSWSKQRACLRRGTDVLWLLSIVGFSDCRFLRIGNV